MENIDHCSALEVLKCNLNVGYTGNKNSVHVKVPVVLYLNDLKLTLELHAATKQFKTF